MNERIKELAERLDTWYPDQGWFIFNDEQLEKFSELLIRECLVILNQNNPRPPGTVILYSMDQDQHFDTGWQVAVETKQARIKQHFGVEE